MSLERYLDHIESIDSIIKEKENLIKKYDAELENCTSHLSDMPRAESSSNDKMNSLISEKIKVKEEIQQKVSEWKSTRIKIDRCINSMSNPLYQDILIKRYYHNMSIKELSQTYKVSESHINNTIWMAKKDFEKRSKKE